MGVFVVWGCVATWGFHEILVFCWKNWGFPPELRAKPRSALWFAKRVRLSRDQGALGVEVAYLHILSWRCGLV